MAVVSGADLDEEANGGRVGCSGEARDEADRVDALLGGGADGAHDPALSAGGPAASPSGTTAPPPTSSPTTSLAACSGRCSASRSPATCPLARTASRQRPSQAPASTRSSERPSYRREQGQRFALRASPQGRPVASVVAFPVAEVEGGCDGRLREFSDPSSAAFDKIGDGYVNDVHPFAEERDPGGALQDGESKEPRLAR